MVGDERPVDPPALGRPALRTRGRRSAHEYVVDLDEHIAFVIDALRPIAPELGLRTAAPAAS